MLAERIKVLRDYIAAVHRGELPPNHSLLRAINGLCSRLPVMSARTQIADFVQESNDVLLLSYLATLTGASTTANEVGLGEDGTVSPPSAHHSIPLPAPADA